MKRILGLGVAAILVGLLLITHPATASVSAVAYFTRNPAASPPTGGIEVANAPDGIISSGAIRAAENGGDISSATVNLPEASVTRPPAPPAGVPGADPGAILLRACPAMGEFKAGKGTLAEAPKANCDAGSAMLVRDGTGTWSADVTALLSGASPAIAIVPALGAGSFQVTFKPPTLDVQMKASSGGTGVDSSFDASEFGGSSGASSSGGSSSGSSGDRADRAGRVTSATSTARAVARAAAPDRASPAPRAAGRRSPEVPSSRAPSRPSRSMPQRQHPPWCRR